MASVEDAGRGRGTGASDKTWRVRRLRVARRQVSLFCEGLYQTSLWRVPVDGGEETRILESVMGSAFHLDRKGVYFVAPRTAGTSAVQFLSFATGKVTTIAVIHRPVGFGLSVSPDERFILYTQEDQVGSNLMLM